MKLDSLSVPKLIQFGPNGLIDSFNFHTVVYDDIVINRNTLSPILDDQCFQILHLHDIAHSRISMLRARPSADHELDYSWYRPNHFLLNTCSATFGQSALHHFTYDLLRTRFQLCPTGIHGEFWIFRDFVGR